ncbi:MAG: efflux RND transporter permease subunit, partial [Aestuariivirgaceae bacterium]
MITRLALDNTRVTIMLVLLIIGVGLQVYLNYPSAEDPTIKIRQATIVATHPGMSPERMEQLITDRIETKMREIAEIDEIKSTSKTGEVTVDLILHDEVTDLTAVFQNIRNKANDLKSELPGGTNGPFVFDDKGLTAVATIALWADGFSMKEMHDVARDIRTRLYTLKGIKRVELYGVQDERIYLDFDTNTLARYGVAPQQIFTALSDQNIIEPGGQITAGAHSILIEPTGDFGSVEDIRNVVFRIPDTNRVARLSDVVAIRRDYIDPPQTPVRFNNHEAVVLSVSTADGVNNIEFGTRLKALIDNIQQEVPVGYALEFATFQPALIAESVQGAVSNVYQTLVIVLVVVMVFLGLRTGLIVGSFVPLTMLLGIVVMRLLDVELQRMSIAAMIIALGLLVDNGIVVAEDIRSRLERGTERMAAALAAGSSLAVPLLTSSLTTILAFLPMILLEGAAGEYVKSLAQVVTILLLASWLFSMTLTPVLCAWFMKVGTAPDQASDAAYDGALYRIYRGILTVLLRWRVAFIAGLVAILVLSVQLLGLIKTEFFPVGARSQFLVYVDFEAGTNVRSVQSDLKTLTRWLADERTNPEIDNHILYIGSGGPRFFLALAPVDPDPHRAFILINTKSTEDVAAVIPRVNRFMDENLPAARSDAKEMWFGGTEPGVVEVQLTGPDGKILAPAAAKIEAAFTAVPGTLGVKHDWDNQVLKLIVDVNQVRARRAGVTSTDVAKALSTVFTGTRISEYREGDRILPIELRGTREIRDSLAGLQRVSVISGASGDFVALGQIADVRAQWQYGRIVRRDQQRTLTVQARNPSISAPDLLAAIQPTLDKLTLPAGYT